MSTKPVIYGFNTRDDDNNIVILAIPNGWSGGPIEAAGNVGSRTFVRFPNVEAVQAADPTSVSDFAEATEDELNELGELPKYPS